ncbi:hypothetical protein LguiB_025305 [Lonicera macranthoides]
MDGIECEFEFWPIEHPTEPLDEDRPLKCPMSHSPSLTNDSKIERQWKSAEVSAEAEMGAEEGPPPPRPAVGGLRKRHHKLTQEEDHTITPLLRMPQLYPYQQPHDITIFDMLHHFNKFQSSS